MSSKDEKNLKQVVDRIASMDEPRRSTVQRVHEVIVATAPELKPRIWYGMPAYALSASTPALITLRDDERLNLALTEKAPFRAAGGEDGGLMPAAWYFESVDDRTEHRIAAIVRSVLDRPDAEGQRSPCPTATAARWARTAIATDATSTPP